MAKLRFEIITAERIVHTDEVDIVLAPGIEGQLGILPHHAPLMTMLQPGEIMVRKGEEESFIFVSGGFLEVRGEKVVVLADTAERSEEIDISRAEEARQRAEDRMKTHPPDVDMARAEVALRRSLARIKVAERRRKRRVAEQL
ncbi:F0F1 ATP synthase subunit epsilon [Chloroflexota bacterium]